MTSGSQRKYYRHKVNDFANEIDENDNTINNNKTTTSIYFKYKTKTIGRTSNNNSRLNAEVAIPLKYLINFCRYLDLLLINCEIEIDLTCSTYSIISQVSKTFREVDPNADPNGYEEVIATTGAKLQIDNAKLYVPVVTLPINDNIKF